jgi:predicted outer membrane repeat protein
MLVSPLHDSPSAWSAGTSATAASQGSVVYVNASAAPGGDGSSWDKALNTIPENLAAGTEVWIAKGTYAAGDTQADTAGSTDARANSIKLSAGVQYYGGFDGTETQRGQRDVQANKTVLTGERGQAGNSDNSYTVVQGARDAVLDGFAVTGGNAVPDASSQTATATTPQAGGQSATSAQQPPNGPPSGSGAPSGPGASGGPPNGAPNGAPNGSTGGGTGGTGGGAPVHLTPDMILQDAADGQVVGAGGGISITDGMRVSNTEVYDNKAVKGGGIYVMTAEQGSFPSAPGDDTSAQQVVLDNVNVHDNEALNRGGGIEAELGSKLLITDSQLANNHSDKGGGLYLDFRSDATLLNSSVTNNTANSGAGLASDGGGRLALGQSTVSGNRAEDEGGGIYLGTGEMNQAALVNSVVSGNSSGGSGADTYAWHGNQFSAVNSRVDDGDFTAQPNAGSSSELGASLESFLPGAQSLGMLQQFDQMMPNTQSSATPSGPSGQTTSGGTAASSPTPSSDRVIYVDDNAAPGGNGSSWDSAYSSLADALKDADTDNAQVWMAGGTYKPEGEQRDATFKIPDGVRVYGGFAGNESSLDQRVAGSHETTLDGDLGAQGDYRDNAYHVVTGGNDITLDGLSVRNGNADGNGYDGHGGGMVNYANQPQGRPDQEQGFTNIAINNVTFADNRAKDGGAMYNYGRSDIDLTNSVFAGNFAENGGAIMDRVGVYTNAQNVQFIGNQAEKNGGAYYVDYGSRLNGSQVDARDNRAGNDGGVVYAASRASQLEESVVALDHATLSGNTAGRQGNALAIDDMAKAYVTNSSVQPGDADVSVSANSSLQATAPGADTFVRQPTQQAPTGGSAPQAPGAGTTSQPPGTGTGSQGPGMGAAPQTSGASAGAQGASSNANTVSLGSSQDVMALIQALAQNQLSLGSSGFLSLQQLLDEGT